jgi:hypothetical protein
MRMSITLRILDCAKLRSLVPRIRAFSLILCLRLEDITTRLATEDSHKKCENHTQCFLFPEGSQTTCNAEKKDDCAVILHLLD